MNMEQWVRQSSPNYARLRQSSYESRARMLLVRPGTCLISAYKLMNFDASSQVLANKGLPLPLGRGVRETKSKNGRSRPRKPNISRGFLCSEGG